MSVKIVMVVTIHSLTTENEKNGFMTNQIGTGAVETKQTIDGFKYLKITGDEKITS